MEVLYNLANGFKIILTLGNLSYCFLGVFLGTFIGVLPGLGPSATLALLLPITYYLGPTSAIIMLAGIIYGAQYGGSTTSILVNIPGESGSIVTTFDGYQMALQGRAGPALGISAFGSFIAGTISIIGLMIAAPPLAKFALRFGPPEFTALIFMAFSLLMYLAAGSILKAAMISVVGIFVGTIGTDLISGELRFTYGSLTLSDGVGLVPIVMGVFGIAEVLTNVEKDISSAKILKSDFKGLLPSRQDWRDSTGAIFRGSTVGFFLGIIPGGAATVATFASYVIEKRISKYPEKFGKGAIAGVAGPESANNAASISHFIPLMTLGIPVTPAMAILFGALLMQGVLPGPRLIVEHPDVFWGLVASMYIGNIMLLVLNLPLIPLWVRVLNIQYRVLFPLILLFCLIGVYSLNRNTQEIPIMIFFGVFGYLMRKFEYEPAPFIFAIILGPILENSLRQSLLMSEGSFTIFFTRPISCTLMIIGIILYIISAFLGRSRKVFETEQ